MENEVLSDATRDQRTISTRSLKSLLSLVVREYPGNRTTTPTSFVLPNLPLAFEVSSPLPSSTTALTTFDPDSSKIYADDDSWFSGHGRAYESYGIDPSSGCIVVVRPDQYVSLVCSLESYTSIGSFFEGFMREKCQV